jgi:class 3 adenylate cyclase/tetratricopeptide (TPR) repeat protein/DNA-binding XRE family transcriptional regulator
VVDGPVTGQAGLGFGGLLRRLRDEAGLTQDELAEAARVSQRAISDLERGVNATARKDTALLLAAALGLDGPARELFVAAARGRAPAAEVLAAAAGAAGPGGSAAVSRALPRDTAAFTGRQGELGQLIGAGIVTFLFTDIEGSTGLLRRVGEGVYARLLADHHALIRSVLAAHGGRELNTLGDGFFAAFWSPQACVAAVVAMQQVLEGHAWPGGERVRVRMGVHTGEASDTAVGPVGLDVHRAARVAAVAHGGQVLVSETAAALVRDALPPGVALVDLGVHQLKDLGRPERIFQLSVPGLQAEFPPLRTLSTPAAAATRTLPRDVGSFTGREPELARLLAGVAVGRPPAGIRAIDGMAGVGKTTLAVHAAHKLAPGFPGGQFFLPLHAHTPGQRPVDPADALASLLTTAGVTAQQIPPGLEARAGRWRDHVAGKRILLVLDDAAGHEQVRPLLPGTPGSLVLITSRRRLAALEDPAVISMDVMAPGEAAVLLARLAGRADMTSEAGPAGEIIRLCGYLPLAIGMLASQLRHHPARTAADLAAGLAAASDRLAIMRAENLSVAAAFDLSYADLTAAQQRLFRRLGLVPGHDIDGYAAAALEDTSLHSARRLLDELYDHHLITEPAPGRYLLHDLLRQHARALADADSPADSAATAGRLLDYYLHTALAASRHLAFWTSSYRRPLPGHPPAQAPEVSTHAQAAAWLEAERANLHAAAESAAGCGLLGHAIAIPAVMSGFLHAKGYRDQSTALHQIGLTAARQAGDRLGEADTLAGLGVLQGEAGDYSAAVTLARAVALYGDAGDLPGQGDALNQLGYLRVLTGDYPAAAASIEQALALARGASDRSAEADALIHLGDLRVLTGDYPAAVASLQQALTLCREIGNLEGQAEALNCLGAVQQETGDYPAAAASHQQALALWREAGDQIGPAMALNELGVVQQLTGDYIAAAASHQQALALCREFGHRHGQAWALNRLGELSARTSATGQARDHHAQALAIARDLHAPLEEARALEGLGQAHLQDGNISQATEPLQQALLIYRRIGNPGEQRIQQTLRHHGL